MLDNHPIRSRIGSVHIARIDLPSFCVFGKNSSLFAIYWPLEVLVLWEGHAAADFDRRMVCNVR